MPDQPAQKSMLDFLRESYKALEEYWKPQPGPTLTVERVEERGKTEPAPAERLLDKHSPEAAEKLRQAEPASPTKEAEIAPRQQEERPTELKQEHKPPGTKPTPTLSQDGITFTNRPSPSQPRQPEREDLLITSSRSADQRTKEPMPHEKLIAKVEERPKKDSLELAKARLAAIRASDKAHEQGRSLELFADPGKGRRLR